MQHNLLPLEVPIVIVGAGPTGLTAANLLGQAGITTIVIERNAETCTFPRAVSIDDEGLRILQAAGLLEEVLAHIRPAVRAHYVSQSHILAKVAPKTQRNGFPLISTFHQPTLEHILLKGLERFPCVKVYFQHALESFQQDAHTVHLSVQTPDTSLVQMECTYLLACDGGKSSIRRMLDIPMRSPNKINDYHSRGKEWGSLFFWRRSFPNRAPTRGIPLLKSMEQGQRWLVIDAIGESEPANTILFFCNPARPAVSVPGPGTQRRWEFMLLPGEQPEDLLCTDTAQQLIRAARRSIPRGFYPSATHTIPPLQITRQTIYTFHAMLATRFSQGRVFLLGDAAHLMPPFGGQGMNSGLRDAHNLCWKLQQVLQNNTNPSLLESYHVERYPHVSEMIKFSSFLGKVIMTTQSPIALVRDLILRGIDKISPTRESLSEMRIKPQPRYTHGLLLKSSTRETPRLVGTFLPQPYILTQEGLRIQLDTILGNTFALIKLSEKTEENPFSLLKHPIWKRLNLKFIAIKSPKKDVGGRFIVPANPTIHNIIDPELILTNLLQNRHDLYMLVRPDRYVLSTFSTKNIAQIEQELQTIFPI